MKSAGILNLKFGTCATLKCTPNRKERIYMECRAEREEMNLKQRADKLY